MDLNLEFWFLWARVLENLLVHNELGAGVDSFSMVFGVLGFFFYYIYNFPLFLVFVCFVFRFSDCNTNTTGSMGSDAQSAEVNK